MWNFLGAIGIGVVIGLAGGLWLRRRHAPAIWQMPVLAVAGALVASVLALIFGDPQYGWKEPILQVVLAAAGVAAVAVLRPSLGSGSSSATTGSPATE